MREAELVPAGHEGDQAEEVEDEQDQHDGEGGYVGVHPHDPGGRGQGHEEAAA